MAELTGSVFDFLLPDVGEGLEEAEIVLWKVSIGEQIVVNQPIVEIESAKALVELPSPYAGTVLELLVPVGKIVSVGTAIIRIQLNEAAPVVAIEVNSERTEILVGSGPRTQEGLSRRRTPRNYGGHVTPATPIIASDPAPTAPIAINPSAGLASPLVRKLARELGVDLTSLVGSGADGAVTHQDVLRISEQRKIQPITAADSREVRSPIRGVRRVMAEAMVASAFTAPHVTEFVTVDVSAAMQLLEKLRVQTEFAGIKLSPLTLLARAICLATRQTPQVNSFWDGPAQEIVTKEYVNLGIATATERGLLVPNIKDAEQLTLKELALAINELVDAARTGKTAPAAMSGGTISITNIGVFGIDSGTPILPPGEAVIICLGAVAQRPWVVAGEIVIRQVTTISISFDHRLVDGAQGSKFLADIAQMLQEPESLI